MIHPLNNNVLVEVINENEGLVGATTDDVRKGILRDWGLSTEHLTASAGHTLFEGIVAPDKMLTKLKGKVVYWEEYSDTGKKFNIDGKDYSLIPFYRLIGYDE